MKILYLTPIFPGPGSGGGLRSLHLLKSLGRHGRVHVVCQSLRPDEDLEAAAALRAHAERVELVDARTNRLYHKRARGLSWSERIQALLTLEPWHIQDAFSDTFAARICDVEPERFDLIVARYDVTAQYLLKHPRASALLGKTVVDVDDVMPRVLTRTVRELPWGYPKLRYALEAALTRRLYRQLRRAAACFVSSEMDRNLLIEHGWAQHIFVVPNTVEVNGYDPALHARETASTMLFCGSLDYRPNQEAVRWFCQHVLPRMRQMHPTARLLVVGGNPPESIRALGRQPGVSLAGSVASVSPYYQQAMVVIAPILNGGGTRVKILEAMAHGKPVVSTSVGCEGLGAVSGEHLAVADTLETFAEACVQLLGSPQARAAMARSAHAFVKERYDLNALDRRLDEFFSWYRTR